MIMVLTIIRYIYTDSNEILIVYKPLHEVNICFKNNVDLLLINLADLLSSFIK